MRDLSGIIRSRSALCICGGPIRHHPVSKFDISLREVLPTCVELDVTPYVSNVTFNTAKKKSTIKRVQYDGLGLFPQFSIFTIALLPTGGGQLPELALVFLGTNQEQLRLGPASLPAIAQQIVTAEGPSGPNTLYLFNLANFMRQEVPEQTDEHLMDLEVLVRQLIAKNDCS